MPSSSLKCPKSNKKDKKYRRNSSYCFTAVWEGEKQMHLTWKHWFEKGVIKIRSTVSRDKNYRTFIKNGTKTYVGIRDIPIRKGLKEGLEKANEYKKRQQLCCFFYCIIIKYVRWKSQGLFINIVGYFKGQIWILSKYSTSIFCLISRNFRCCRFSGFGHLDHVPTVLFIQLRLWVFFYALFCIFRDKLPDGEFWI